MTKLTKGERIARERLFQHLAALEVDAPDWTRVERQAPQAWHLIQLDLDVTEPKEKVTLYLDRSVAQLFRGMGPGWQARANRVLATWVAMQIGGMIRFREAFHGRKREMLAEDMTAIDRGERPKGVGIGAGRGRG